MKRIAVAAAVLSVLAVLAAPFVLFLWPVHNLHLSASAPRRVAADITAGMPAAETRTKWIRTRVHADYPESAEPRYAWQEVRCSIEDLSAQLSVGDYAQVCSLRSVALIPIKRSRWDDCRPSDPGGLGDEDTFTVVRARSWMFSPKYDDVMRCPVLGAGSREGDRSRLVHGRRPPGLGQDVSWEIIEIEVPLSETMIGCTARLPACVSTFDAPDLSAVAGLQE